MPFSLADERLERMVYDAIFLQDMRKQRKIFRLHRILQGDAGSRNKNRAANGLCSENGGHSRHQIGKSFPDPCSRVAQRDLLSQHGIQHLVTQLDLRRALYHTMLWKKIYKNMIYQLMGFQPVIVLIHIIVSPLSILLFFAFYRICSSHPDRKREQYGQGPARPSRAISWDLCCFQPQGSPAVFAGQCGVSHYLPRIASMRSGAANAALSPCGIAHRR